MLKPKIEELKKQYTDKYVKADDRVPELARFASRVGRVVTVNHNGLALVDFEDGPWYDIALNHLTVVPKPEPPPAAAHAKPVVEKKPAPEKTSPEKATSSDKPAAEKPAVAKPAVEKKPIEKKPIPKAKAAE